MFFFCIKSISKGRVNSDALFCNNFEMNRKCSSNLVQTYIYTQNDKIISWCITFVICFIRVSCLPTPSLDLLHKIHLLSLSIRGAGVSVHSFHGHVNHYSRAIGLVKALRNHFVQILWSKILPPRAHFQQILHPVPI